MAENKIRTYVTPSSLGSYFGVGFKTPEEQFSIDIGKEKDEFDDEAILRLELGNYLENASIDYFQNIIFKAPITNRNEEVKFGLDGKVKYAIDGIINIDGNKGIFENKISNAVSGRFTTNMGYLIQLQTYMLLEGLDYGILAGLYQGKPIYKKYDKDVDMQKDIITMIEFIHKALNGLVDFYDDFPVELLDKYSTSKLYEPIDNLSSITVNYLTKLAELKNQESIIKKEIKMLEQIHENDFDIDEGVYEDDNIIVRVSKVRRDGGFDLDLFKEKNPYIDVDSYMKPAIEYTLRRIKLKDPS